MKNNNKNLINEKQIIINGIATQYSVNTQGEIYSLNYRHTKKRQKLKQNTDRDGYKTVVIYIQGKPKTMKVHRLVATAFIPNIYNKPEVNHIDCDPSHNEASNLEWCTTKENITWSWLHGNKKPKYSDDSPYHKYQVSVIKKVCKLLEKNEDSIGEIAKKTGVAYATVLAVKSKNAWTMVSKDYNIENHTVNASIKMNEETVHNICKEFVKNELTLTEIAKKI